MAVGTPGARSDISDLRPWTQSAELHTRPATVLMTSARCAAPTSKMQVCFAVDTTLMVNCGFACAGYVGLPTTRLITMCLVTQRGASGPPAPGAGPPPLAAAGGFLPWCLPWPSWPPCPPLAVPLPGLPVPAPAWLLGTGLAVADGLGEAAAPVPPDPPLPPPAGPLVPAPAPCSPPAVTFPAALIGLGWPIAPETAQASTPKMDRPMSSAKNRRRQYVAGDPFPRRLLIVLSPIR